MDAALRKLPEAFRTVVVLREMEGFCYEEIGEILEVPAGTVKSRLDAGTRGIEADSGGRGADAASGGKGGPARKPSGVLAGGAL